jgi:hypothetical protein
MDTAKLIRSDVSVINMSGADKSTMGNVCGEIEEIFTVILSNIRLWWTSKWFGGCQ